MGDILCFVHWKKSLLSETYLTSRPLGPKMMMMPTLGFTFKASRNPWINRSLIENLISFCRTCDRFLLLFGRAPVIGYSRTTSTPCKKPSSEKEENDWKLQSFKSIIQCLYLCTFHAYRAATSHVQPFAWSHAQFRRSLGTRQQTLSLDGLSVLQLHRQLCRQLCGLRCCQATSHVSLVPISKPWRWLSWRFLFVCVEQGESHEANSHLIAFIQDREMIVHGVWNRRTCQNYREMHSLLSLQRQLSLMYISCTHSIAWQTYLGVVAANFL